MESYADTFTWHLMRCIRVCEWEREKDTHRENVSEFANRYNQNVHDLSKESLNWDVLFYNSLYFLHVSWNWCLVYLTAVEFFTAIHFLLALFIVLRFRSNAEICSFHLLEKTLICNATLVIRLFSHIYLRTYLTTKPCVGKKSQWLHLRSTNMKNTWFFSLLSVISTTSAI